MISASLTRDFLDFANACRRDESVDVSRRARRLSLVILGGYEPLMAGIGGGFLSRYSCLDWPGYPFN